MTSVPATVSALPTEDAKVVRRKVYDAIEAVYDEKRKCYGRGLNGYHTDEPIAKSVGCALNLVSKLREEFFGPAAPDEPTEDIKAFQITLDHLERDLETFASDLQAHIRLTDGLKEQLTKLRKQKGDVAEALKEMCEANGWYH